MQEAEFTETKQTVFVLVNDWSYDFEVGNNVAVFSTLEKAQEAMNKGFEEFRKRNGLDGEWEEQVNKEYDPELDEEDDECLTWDRCSISETCITVCEEGNYTGNHVEWEIHECAIL